MNCAISRKAAGSIPIRPIGPHYDPEVDLASNKNEYWGIYLGGG